MKQHTQLIGKDYDMEEYEVKVTRIKNQYHARLIKDGKVRDEMACILKEDIGYICREMLRWACKLGAPTPFAQAARKRQNENEGPKGKIYYIGC